MSQPIPKAPDDMEPDFEEYPEPDEYHDFLEFVNDHFEPLAIVIMIKDLVIAGHSTSEATRIAEDIIRQTMDLLE